MEFSALAAEGWRTAKIHRTTRGRNGTKRAARERGALCAGTAHAGPAQIRLVYRERDVLNYGPHGGTIAAMDTDKFYCGTMATVTFTGDVTACSVIRKGVGNIRITPFARILEEHLGELIHDPLHDERNMPAPCGTCRDNTHCWGCRASAYYYGGDANGPDPKCWVMTEVRDPGSPAPIRILDPRRTS